MTEKHSRRVLNRESLALLLMLAAGSIAGAAVDPWPGDKGSVIQWTPLELTFTSSQPLSWRSFPMQVTFRNDRRSITLDAFWDGGQTWKVHFAPSQPGTWSYLTTSSDPGLDGKSGSVTCVGPTEPQRRSNANLHGLLRVGPTGHYFVHADGTPLLLFSDCILLERIPAQGGHFADYLSKRNTQGFNAINARLAKMGAANEGGEAYPSHRVDSLNPQYFDWADERLSQAWGAGFVAIYFPDFVGTGNYSLQDAKDVTRYLLARYAVFNALHILTGEFDNKRRLKPPFNDLSAWKELGAFAKGLNDKAYHVPMSMHPLNSSGPALHNEAWLDFDQVQAKVWNRFDALPREVLDDYQRTPDKPVFYAEGTYENQTWANELGTASIIRHQIWVALLSGAAGVDYGENHVKQESAQWAKYLDSPGAVQVGHARHFLEQVQAWNLVPRPQWVQVDGKSAPAPRQARTARPYYAADDNHAVIYLMKGLADVQVSLSHLPRGARLARFFDPRENRFIPINGSPDPRQADWVVPPRPAPADEDWVVVIDAG